MSCVTPTVHPKPSLWSDGATRGGSTAVVEVMSRDSLNVCNVVGVKTGAQDTPVTNPSRITLIVRQDGSDVSATRARTFSLDDSRSGRGLFR